MLPIVGMLLGVVLSFIFHGKLKDKKFFNNQYGLFIILFSITLSGVFALADKVISSNLDKMEIVEVYTLIPFDDNTYLKLKEEKDNEKIYYFLLNGREIEISSNMIKKTLEDESYVKVRKIGPENRWYLLYEDIDKYYEIHLTEDEFDKFMNN